MQVRRLAAVAALGVLAASTYAPATAAPKAKPKPITKSYAMQLAPVPDPVQGSPSCARPELEGISIHTETFKTTGPGVLKVSITGFAGDWDITVYDGARNELGVGDGTSTGGGAPATAGVETFTMKFKKASTIAIASCNFAGSPNAKGSYTYTYS